MEAVKKGNSIECLSAEIISRDIKLSAFINLPNFGKCRKYNCKKNSEASIRKELNDKTKKAHISSYVDLGDKIMGENLALYVKTVKSLKIEVVNYTGRHKAQQTSTDCHTFAEVTLQFHNIRVLNDPKQLDK